MKYDVAINTTDGDLAGLLALLLTEAGYTSTICRDCAPADARLLIVDFDSVSETNGKYRGIIGISRQPEKIPEATRSKCRALLCRPFGFNDFTAAVKEAHERSGKITAGSNGGRMAKIEFDEAERRVSSGAKSVTLTPNEAAILAALLKRHETVTREEIASLIGKDRSNMPEVYICTLRRKLGETLGASGLIQTVRGKGYRIK